MLNARIGFVFPIMGTATGRAFAAHLPRALAEEAIVAEYRAGHGKAPSSAMVKGLFEQLAAIRAEGLSRDVGAYFKGVSALAVPVFGHDGNVLAVLTALGQEGLFDVGPDSMAATIMRRAARVLTGQLGGQTVQIKDGI